MKSMDENQDGAIQYEEFMEWIYGSDSQLAEYLCDAADAALPDDGE